MKRFLQYILFSAVVISMASCSVTRNLSEDQYILNKNKINTDNSVEKEEKITARELNRYIRQQPAPKFIGTNLPIWIYNQADPDKDNGWNNLLRRLGSEPTILDTTLTHLSTTNLKLYMDSRGFRESVSDYQITYKPKRQRANVTYTVWQGKAYRIGNITYEFQDKFLEQVIKADSVNTLLHTGDPFDTNVMNEERMRIVNFLRDRGYYSFSTDNIKYTAYMDEGDYEVDIRMTVGQHFVGYDDNDEPVMANNAVYRLNKIYIFPDYDMVTAAQDPLYFNKMDTVYYQGIGVVSSGRPKVKPSTLRRTANIYTGDIYSLTDARRAVENLMRLGYYKSANITFDEIIPEGEQEYVTYVGGDGEAEAVESTLQQQLDCTIYCTPYKRQYFSVDLEGTLTELFYGIKVNGTYRNRNLFRGSELFDLGITAGYEFFREEGTSNSFELGATAGITFPRFLTPFPVDRANRAIRPTTRLEASINTQNRPGNYKRTITGINLSYGWTRGKSNYTLRPLSFHLVKSELDPDYEEELEGLRNLYLIESYRSQFIPAIGFSQLYSNPTVNLKGHSLTMRNSLETSGNIFTGVAGLVDKKRETDYATLFGVRITQYVRGDVNASYTIPFGEKWAFASRLFAGVAIPYGNSTVIPIDRQYYSGGAYSMRGWQVRALGPGSFHEDSEGGAPQTTRRRMPMQTGDIRLEANAELRFPITGALNGALFFDLGNVWKLPKTADNTDQEFRFNRFYKQLGFNTGIGLRIDLQLVVIRLDWGVQLHNPNRVTGQRWISAFKWADTALNFGIGYPF